MLTPEELSRYARQLVLPEIGLAGQEKLRAARVLVVGAGGLGSPAALYLAAAGVGRIGILDDDRVELSNLHRQVLHAARDVGLPKAESAAASLRALNDRIDVCLHETRLTAGNARDLIAGYDLVVDGSDNYPTRYAVNDACASLRKTWVYGSVERFAGQVSAFGHEDGPCYRCLFAEPPSPGSTQSCEAIGVLGAVPGVVGSLQAVEALKCILGIGRPLAGRLLQVDFLSGGVHIIEFARRADCQACGTRGDSTNGSRAAASSDDDDIDVQPAELAARLRDGEHVVLIDVREPWETSVARIAESRQLPMRDLPDALATLDRDRELILYCHHGSRSSMAAEWLRSQGFRARSLVGGIDRWSVEIDSALPRY